MANHAFWHSGSERTNSRFAKLIQWTLLRDRQREDLGNRASTSVHSDSGDQGRPPESFVGSRATQCKLLCLESIKMYSRFICKHKVQ